MATGLSLATRGYYSTSVQTGLPLSTRGYWDILPVVPQFPNPNGPLEGGGVLPLFGSGQPGFFGVLPLSTSGTGVFGGVLGSNISCATNPSWMITVAAERLADTGVAVTDMLTKSEASDTITSAERAGLMITSALKAKGGAEGED